MIKYLVMDVDGSLTDGKIYMSNSGELFKAFNIKDGCGIKDILPLYKITPVIITARESKILTRRCDELGVSELYQNIRDKKNKLDEVLNRDDQAQGYKDCAYFGDDILDLKCMLPIKDAGGIVGCPADAVKEVKAAADYICINKAGDGALREFIEWIISCTDKINADNKVEEAIEYIQDICKKELMPGKYVVNDSFYFMVQEYEVREREECRLESHKKYADIQFFVEGTETIETANISGLQLIDGYSEDEDVMFWKSVDRMARVVLKPGSYAVLYPHDAYMCYSADKNSTHIRKIVGKVKIIG